MASTVLVFIATLAGAHVLIKRHQEELRHPTSVFYSLFFYHLFFFGVYYAYALATASDSFNYYNKVERGERGNTWMDFYDVGTMFIEFIAYPFINFFGFSYEAMMLLFSFLGFVGFLYMYLFIVERIEYRHKLFGFDFILLLLFLPNMHFWTVSLGKGSIIFFGIALFFYGVSKFTIRPLTLALGALVVFNFRYHILKVILLALGMSALFSSKGIKTWQKAFIIAAVLTAITPVFNTFLEYIQLEDTSQENLDQFTQHRGSELGKATSGVDITGYSQPMKLFTFLFRPLFVDAPNALGLIISVENLLYLFLFLKLASPSFIRYIFGAHWLVKVALLTFIGASFALAQVSGNMGIAIRQKSQVMYLFLFVLLAYADWAYRKERKVVIGE